MAAENDEHVFIGWNSQSRYAIVLSTEIQEVVLDRGINFPSRRGKTLSHIEVAFI